MTPRRPAAPHEDPDEAAWRRRLSNRPSRSLPRDPDPERLADAPLDHFAELLAGRLQASKHFHNCPCPGLHDDVILLQAFALKITDRLIDFDAHRRGPR